MLLTKRSILHICVFAFTLAMVITNHYPALAEEQLCSADKALLEKYPAIKTSLENNQFGIPIYLESKDENNLLRVDLYGILDYPFETIKEAIQSPAAWCDVTSLLLNIKASTCSKISDQWKLTIYTGKKIYQPPKEAFKQDFSFKIAELDQGYIDIKLTSKDGPFFTKDHRIMFEAAPLDEGRTFMHFVYDYRCGFLARTAMKAYYDTIGHDKKGFSIIAVDKKGNPIYQDGVKGSEERNAVRCYLAIQTYMDTLRISEDQKLDEQLTHWYDLTEKFPLQLHDLEKEEYLANKKKEHTNQLLLQKEALVHISSIN